MFKMEKMFLVFLLSTAVCVPSAGQEVLQYSIKEESPVGTHIGNIGEDSNLRKTSSAEDFSQISYSFLTQGKDYENFFDIDVHNGSMYTSEVIDRESVSDCAYESKCVLSLSVVAKSKISAFFRSVKVNVTVMDINDHPPKFSKDVTYLDISEVATIGSSVALVGAEDSDSGNNTLQRYYILADPQSDETPFETSYERYVDGSSVVKLVITGDLDRETRDEYSLVIVAEDGGDPKLTGTMSVVISIDDTNDNSPKFTEDLYTVNITETSEVGTEFLTLSASDADLGVNSEIEYRLSRNQVGRIHDLFAVNETSGVLSVKGVFSSGGQYRIIVEASDKGAQPLMSQAVVVVTVLDSNNNPPEININLFSDTGFASVSEYADIGTVVAHIALIDKDTGINGLITCNIASDNDVFRLQSLDVNEYKVTVAKGLDRETMDNIYIIINCYDKGSPPLNSFAEFTVQVLDENDNSPKFLQEIYFVDINENNNLDIDVVQVSAIDGDIGKNGEISYSVWAIGKYQFSMDPLSGIIKTTSVFDREEESKITIYAHAKDSGNPSRISTATVVISVLDENDNDPAFDKPIYEFTVLENVPGATSMGEIKASDMDSGDNARLGLYIDESLPFTISDSGELATRFELDRENKSIYSFMVQVYDHGVPSRNTSASVVVHVLDINDNAPTFVYPDAANYTVEVDADALPKTVIAKIKAFDLDSDKNSQLFFSIVNSNVSDLFTIDGYNGDITLLRALSTTDREIYNIVLRVDDNGNPRKSASTSLNLFIVRRSTPAPVPSTRGENLLIAITLGTVTFVLVFTIVLVICVLKRKSNGDKNRPNREEDFYDRDRANREKRVQFADIVSGSHSSGDSVSKAPVFESMATFGCDGNESRDSDMTSSTVDMETPILEKSKINMNSPPASRHDNSSTSGPMEARHSTPRSDFQLSALHTHSALLNSTVKPATSFSASGHEDNHSQTSGETITSDSGRGGSESDIQSASLSQSHDSDIRSTDLKTFRQPMNSTFVDNVKPWMNLADLRYHNCQKIPVAQQLRSDQRHRLQLRNHGDKIKARVDLRQIPIERTPCTQSHSNFDRSKFVTFKDTSPVFPPPPSETDRSFMTYDEEDDDLSTTTSGSYTIDQEDLTLEMRSSGMKTPGLRSCLV